MGDEALEVPGPWAGSARLEAALQINEERPGDKRRARVAPVPGTCPPPACWWAETEEPARREAQFAVRAQQSTLLTPTCPIQKSPGAQLLGRTGQVGTAAQVGSYLHSGFQPGFKAEPEGLI